MKETSEVSHQDSHTPGPATITENPNTMDSHSQSSKDSEIIALIRSTGLDTSIYTNIAHQVSRYCAINPLRFTYTRAEITRVLKVMGVNETMRKRILKNSSEAHLALCIGEGWIGCIIQHVNELCKHVIRRILRPGLTKSALRSWIVKDHKITEEGCECGVCLEDKVVDETVCMLECGHWGDEECLAKWLMQGDHCGTCRRQVVSINDVDDKEMREEAWQFLRSLGGEGIRLLLKEVTGSTSRREDK